MNKLVLKGLAASAGTAEGKVKIFLPGQKAADFPQGSILVTTITDPTMVQIMIRAAAIVTDIGGITSHPAIVAREMGIPCVVNTKTGTKTLHDGMKVMVDGAKGEVYELDR